MSDPTPNIYAADLEKLRWLLCNAALCIELRNALRTVAEAEAVERRLSHRHDAPLCGLVREAIMARHRDRAAATAALPELREESRKACEAWTMYGGKSPAHLCHLTGQSAGLAQAVELVERAAQAPTGPTSALESPDV